MSFEKLSQIIEIQTGFLTLSSLTIGGGDQPESSAESPVVRIGHEPAIPGSSLKGAMRSSLEAMLSGRGVKVCVPDTAIPNEYRRERSSDDQKKKQNYLDQIDRLWPCDPEKDKPVCAICDLFGTAGDRSGLSGRVLVLDAGLVEKFSTEVLKERMHVAIARDTRSQAGGALVNVETVDKGVEFGGKIRLINPDPWHVGAILRSLEAVAQLGLGAKKTSGYGQLKITPTGITVRKLTDKGWQETSGKDEDYLKAFDEKKVWPRQKS